MSNKIIFLILFIFSVSCSGNKEKQYSSINDATTDRIGVLMGTTQDVYITKNFPQATIVRVDAFSDMLLSLKGDKCDVIVIDASVYKAMCKDDTELTLLDENLYEGPIALAFNPKNVELREEYNKMLAELRADGTYDEIYDRWVNNPNPVMPVFDLPTKGIPLRVGVAAALPPCDFYKDGESVGLDSELVRRLGQRLGRPVEFQIISFGGLVAAIASGKIDVIAAGLSVTPERAKNVAFGDSHYSDNTVSVALRKNIVATVKSVGKRYATKEDLSTKRIAVLMGSTHDAYITKNFPKAEIVRCDSNSDLIMELTSGKCDAALFIPSVYSSVKKSNPQIEILDSNLFQESSGIGFSHSQNTLKEQFNAFLKEIQGSKLYDEIYDRWINNGDNAEMPKIKMATSGQPIRAAVSGTMVPFTFIHNGEHAGFDIEILLRFAQSVNRPIEFSIINFGGLISALNSGKVDVIASFISITPERLSKVNFSDVYLVQNCLMVVLDKNIEASATGTTHTVNKYTTKEDVRTKRIAVLMGTTHDAFVTKNFPDATIIRSETHTDVLMELISGKCDAAIFNPTTYASMKKHYPNIALLDSLLFREDTGIGFSYDQNELKNQFNAFLKDLRVSKLYEEIYARWINYDDSVAMPEIEIPSTGKPIRVGVTGSLIPFTFIRNGEHAGFDIEILRRFAQSINRPIEFSVINFGGLISALSSGKIDVAAAAMTITEERAKKVNFSDPYFYNAALMAVLDKNMATSDVSTTQTVEKQGFFASIGDSFYSNLIAEKRYILILNGLLKTLIISVFAALLGTIIGAVICFMRMSKKVMLNSFAKAYITIVRGIPVLVLLMLLYYAVFAKWDISATIVAILTFALNFAAYVSEMFRTSIQGVDRGQNEAGIAMGFTKVQTFIFVIMPQAVKSVLPVYKGELISLVKMTSVVGYIAVEDLTKASDIIRSRTFDAFFPLIMVAVIYFFLAWGFTALLDSINKKMTTR